MAPDKIYVKIITGGLCVRTKPNEIIREQYLEFIRKDALLEWAKKEMGEWSSESNVAQGIKMGLTLFMDKIESL